jgi:hypothetical protein
MNRTTLFTIASLGLAVASPAFAAETADEAAVRTVVEGVVRTVVEGAAVIADRRELHALEQL